MQILDRTVEASFSPLLRHYTLEDFWQLPDPQDRSHYDLIGGTLYMVPPPDPPHGGIDSRLNKSLIRFLIANNIEGEVLHPREGVYRDAKAATYLEPDMMYVSDELNVRMGKKRMSADIVFEYSSKSTATYDKTTKADTYLALGVRELWLVHSDEMAIEVRHARTRNNQLFWQVNRYESGESAESEVLGGWKVPVNEIFEGLV